MLGPSLVEGSQRDGIHPASMNGPIDSIGRMKCRRAPVAYQRLEGALWSRGWRESPVSDFHRRFAAAAIRRGR